MRPGIKRLSLLAGLSACLCLIGCPEDNPPRKPDPTKGTVTGAVFCMDTGKPGRFAEVQLLPSALFDPLDKHGGHDIDLDETEVTGLDGRFTIEAVPPGEYYAYATLDGYFNVERAIDISRSASNTADDEEQTAEALKPWKDRFVRVAVSAQHTTDITLKLDRGAEIEGTVSYDDSSPAIGVRGRFRCGAMAGMRSPTCLLANTSCELRMRGMFPQRIRIRSQAALRPLRRFIGMQMRKFQSAFTVR